MLPESQRLSERLSTLSIVNVISDFLSGLYTVFNVVNKYGFIAYDWVEPGVVTLAAK